MPGGHGMNGYIGLALESAWGTAENTPTDYVEALSESLSLTQERFEVRNIINRFTEPDDMRGTQSVAGDIVFAAHPESVGHFLNGALGTVAVSSLNTNLALSSFTVTASDNGANNPLPPYTFEIFRDITSAQQYSGGQISALAFSGQPNQDLRCSASIFGKSTTNKATTSPSFPSSPIDPFAFDTASISIAGNATALVEAFTLTINNNFEPVFSNNNSREAAKIRRTNNTQVGITGTLAFEDIVDYERFVNETEFEWKAHYFRANSFSLLFDLPRVIYTAFPTGIDGRGRQTVSFTGRARHHVGSNQMIQVDLTTVSSDFGG